MRRKTLFMLLQRYQKVLLVLEQNPGCNTVGLNSFVDKLHFDELLFGLKSFANKGFIPKRMLGK
jgi:hypothetical protein